jgi:hypothetical protein
MGRQAVIQITCDRCKRVEHRPLSEAKDPPEEGDKSNYMFRGKYKGDWVEFEDLCMGCESILDKHWEAMSKQLQKSSPIRRKGKS